MYVRFACWCLIRTHLYILYLLCISTNVFASRANAPPWKWRTWWHNNRFVPLSSFVLSGLLFIGKWYSTKFKQYPLDCPHCLCVSECDWIAVAIFNFVAEWKFQHPVEMDGIKFAARFGASQHNRLQLSRLVRPLTDKRHNFYLRLSGLVVAHTTQTCAFRMHQWTCHTHTRRWFHICILPFPRKEFPLALPHSANSHIRRVCLGANKPYSNRPFCLQ